MREIGEARTLSDGYKRRFDLTVLVLAHMLLMPLWLLLWTIIPVLIWLSDRGPVFYKQKRVGKDGQVFTILKFRTMVPGAESTGPAWTTEGDPRVTRFGKLLRRMALDELPETLSIWKGDMSLVGPRALDLEEQRGLEQQIPGFAQRLQVRSTTAPTTPMISSASTWSTSTAWAFGWTQGS